jgi:flagellar L-ring protein precursor FlgH
MRIQYWWFFSLIVFSLGSVEAESLWLRATNNEQGMYGRSVASRRGDLVTVQISETANFSTSGMQATIPGRESALQSEVLRLLEGVGKDALNLGADLNGDPLIIGLSKLFSGQFTGGAGTLSTELTVSSYPLTSEVVDVLPNGNLIIAGAKTVSIGKEDLIVVLHGVARPQDITQSNTLSSSQLAHAQVEFVLEGTLSDVSQPGWLSDFVNRVNPF